MPRTFTEAISSFIPLRYALRHGYDLVPCFTVGDSDMFSWLQESGSDLSTVHQTCI